MDCNLFDSPMGGAAALQGSEAPLSAPRSGSSRRALRSFVAVLGLIAVTLPVGAQTVRAQPADEEEDEALFRVQRIELSFYGGYLGGDTYLQLPPLLTPLTNDTALDEILDFSGQSPDPPVEAPTKSIESGWKAGGNAAFYLSPNFGMMLFGEYGRQEAVFTGRRVIDEVLQPNREEIDRADLTTYAGGVQMIYHIGRERKYPVRPFVNLGFGGILNQFSDTDDVGALYFTYGLGLGFPIAGNIRGFVGVDARLFTWETDEVSLNSTLQFPSVLAGLTWRYVVPEDVPDDTGSEQ